MNIVFLDHYSLLAIGLKSNPFGIWCDNKFNHTNKDIWSMPNYIALVLLGKNIGIGSSSREIRKDRFHLSKETRLNVLAGGMLYRLGMDIICSSGETSGPPSEAQAMKRYLQLHFPEIPEPHILLEERENSIDTAGNAQRVAEIVKAKGYTYIRLVTVGYHLKNAVTLFRRHGVSIEQQFTAEEVVQQRSLRHERYLQVWKNTDRIKREKQKETVRKMLLTIGRKGKFLHFIAQKTRTWRPFSNKG